MDLIYQTFPHLRDVWVNHLEPFILPSKEEMDKRWFVVQFALHRIFERSANNPIRASHINWHSTRTWYIQPGVIGCSSQWNIVIYPNNVLHMSFQTYFMRDKGLKNCCSMEFPVRHIEDSARTSRLIDTRYGVRFVLRDNGQIWYYDYDQHVGTEVFIGSELPLDVLSPLCPHVQYCMLMHAVRHRVHTLRHVE
jgi:hypothetical protein